jgi:hypothetical protein
VAVAERASRALRVVRGEGRRRFGSCT